MQQHFDSSIISPHLQKKKIILKYSGWRSTPWGLWY